MENLRNILSEQVAAWARMGLPALLERFVLKHGVEFQGDLRPKGVRKQAMKQCFRNAAQLVWEESMEYYEGYAMGSDIAFPFLHAWNVRKGKVIDTTLKDPTKYQYLGLRFTARQLIGEQVKHNVYGMLDIGMINLDLLRSIDNELVEEALASRSIRPERQSPSAGTRSSEMGKIV